MKGRILTSAIAASLLVSSSAFASIARQMVLGGQPSFTSGNSVSTTAVTGSLWYDDNYNVFYNPSYVNDYKNYVTINKGFEAGWFTSIFDNFVYGVYVNRGAKTAGGAANDLYGSDQFQTPGVVVHNTLTNSHTGHVVAGLLATKRPIELFIGGDTGIKWGLKVTHAYNRDTTIGIGGGVNGEAEKMARYWNFAFGAQWMGFEPFANVTAFTKSENTLTTARSSQSQEEYTVGLRYRFEGWSPYFAYNAMHIGAVNAGMPTAGNESIRKYGFGVGHDSKVADGVHVLKNIGFWWNRTEASNNSAASVMTQDYSEMVVPLNLAVEADVLSWLTLRAGAGYDIVRQQKYARTVAEGAPLASQNVADTVTSQDGTFKYRLGSTFKFGKFNLDSAFGNGSAAPTDTETLHQNTSVGFDSQTFVMVSASYHW